MSRSRVQEILAGRNLTPRYQTYQVFLPDVKPATFDSCGQSLAKPVFRCDLTYPKTQQEVESTPGQCSDYWHHRHHFAAVATTKKTAEHYASLLALEQLESSIMGVEQSPRPKFGVRLENEYETKWLTEAELCVYAQRAAMMRFGL